MAKGLKKIAISCRKCYRFCKRGLRRLTVWDLALLKLAWIALGIIIGAYFAAEVQMYVWYWVLAVIVLGIRPAYLWFKKE